MKSCPMTALWGMGGLCISTLQNKVTIEV
jgi:hypothetical protein